MGGGSTSDIIDEYRHPRDIAERFADIYKDIYYDFAGADLCINSTSISQCSPYWGEFPLWAPNYAPIYLHEW